MIKYLRSKKKGFTLVELVMVIAIIGVLAAIIMPKFSDQSRKAEETAIRANLESIRSAVSLYYSNEGTPPTADLQSLVTGAASGTQYLREIPAVSVLSVSNAFVNSGAAAPTAVAGGGWYHRTDTNEVYCQRTGTDLKSTAYIDY